MLSFEGNEIMEDLGMKQDENFQYAEADLEWVWQMTEAQGIQWLHDKGPEASWSSSASN